MLKNAFLKCKENGVLLFLGCIGNKIGSGTISFKPEATAQEIIDFIENPIDN